MPAHAAGVGSASSSWGHSEMGVPRHSAGPLAPEIKVLGVLRRGKAEKKSKYERDALASHPA